MQRALAVGIVSWLSWSAVTSADTVPLVVQTPVLTVGEPSSDPARRRHHEVLEGWPPEDYAFSSTLETELRKRFPCLDVRAAAPAASAQASTPAGLSLSSQFSVYAEEVSVGLTLTGLGISVTAFDLHERPAYRETIARLIQEQVAELPDLCATIWVGEVTVSYSASFATIHDVPGDATGTAHEHSETTHQLNATATAQVSTATPQMTRDIASQPPSARGTLEVTGSDEARSERTNTALCNNEVVQAGYQERSTTNSRFSKRLADVEFEPDIEIDAANHSYRIGLTVPAVSYPVSLFSVHDVEECGKNLPKRERAPVMEEGTESWPGLSMSGTGEMADGQTQIAGGLGEEDPAPNGSVIRRRISWGLRAMPMAEKLRDAPPAADR